MMIYLKSPFYQNSGAAERISPARRHDLHREREKERVDHIRVLPEITGRRVDSRLDAIKSLSAQPERGEHSKSVFPSSS